MISKTFKSIKNMKANLYIFFQQCFKSCDKQSSTLQNFTKLNDESSATSSVVCCLIVKNKLHTVGETLVLPAVAKMGKIVCGKQYGNKLKCFPLSANTVGRSIENIAEDLQKQILEQIMQCGRFVVQPNEITDISNCLSLRYLLDYSSIMKYTKNYFVSH